MKDSFDDASEEKGNEVSELLELTGSDDVGFIFGVFL